MAEKPTAEELIAYAAATPGASYWFEEVVLRGRPGPAGGVISGAHVLIGLAVPGPGGAGVPAVHGPFGLSVGADGGLARLLGPIVVAQQNTNEAQAADLRAATAR